MKKGSLLFHVILLLLALAVNGLKDATYESEDFTNEMEELTNDGGKAVKLTSVTLVVCETGCSCHFL